MDAIPTAVQPALAFEQWSWVNGQSVTVDPFYVSPPYAKTDAPGKLLKVDDNVNASDYFLPPATSLSRIIYLSQTFGGEPIPVSALVLWPYAPKRSSDGLFSVLAWAHGTSSIFAEGAPSHHKNLWQHFFAPYQMALNGYVVVATDYAGLGVSHDIDGGEIVHPYLLAPSHANDIVYSVAAAQAAFPETLSKNYIAVGHSQGGGAVWGVAERLASSPDDGCLGCVAVSPTTRIIDDSPPFDSLLFAGMTFGMKATMPETNLSEILTAEGMKRLSLAKKIQAGLASTVGILQGAELLQPDYKEQELVQKYVSWTAPGGKDVGCPILIIHGEEDPRINISLTKAAVARTMAISPKAPVQFITLPEMTHAPALTASQSLWTEWIAERFAGKAAGQIADGKPVSLKPARPNKKGAGEQNWYLAAVTEPYQAP